MDSPSKIRINQLGYSALLPQRVTVLTNGPMILRDERGREIRRFDHLSLQWDEASGEQTAAVALHLSVPGTYFLEAEDEQRQIMVREEPWRDVTNALIKGLYYQRCGCALKPVQPVPMPIPPAIQLRRWIGKSERSAKGYRRLARRGGLWQVCRAWGSDCGASAVRLEAVPERML